MSLTNTIILMTSLIGIILAQAVPYDNDNSPDIIATNEVASGTLYWYRKPAAFNHTQSAASLRPNCGANNVVCDGENLALVSLCHDLIEDIRKHHAGEGVDPAAWSACVRNSGGHYCCIVWANGVSDLRQGWLIPAAEKTLDTCKRKDGWISGLARNVLLGHTCTTQCLSNRYYYCTKGL